MIQQRELNGTPNELPEYGNGFWRYIIITPDGRITEHDELGKELWQRGGSLSGVRFSLKIKMNGTGNKTEIVAFRSI